VLGILLLTLALARPRAYSSVAGLVRHRLNQAKSPPFFHGRLGSRYGFRVAVADRPPVLLATAWGYGCPTWVMTSSATRVIVVFRFDDGTTAEPVGAADEEYGFASRLRRVRASFVRPPRAVGALSRRRRRNHRAGRSLSSLFATVVCPEPKDRPPDVGAGFGPGFPVLYADLS
jgi:hypothetical protein